MPRWNPSLIILASAVCLGLTWVCLPQANAKPDRQLSLLGMLEEFRYPESQPLNGVTMSDGATLRGGERTVPSTRCDTILTTPDGFEKVVDYYVRKYGITEEHAPPAKPVDAPEGGQSVFIQNDSLERPFQLRIISVNRDETSTTLVISRAESEKATHIAWSHYVR